MKPDEKPEPWVRYSALVIVLTMTATVVATFLAILALLGWGIVELVSAVNA